MHEPGSQLHMGMNKKWWDGLSKTDQAIITAACAEENSHQMAETNANNGTYLTKLIRDHGVKLRAFNDDVYDAFGKAAEEVFAEVQAHSPLAKKIHENFVGFRADVGRWMLLADAGYINQRNRVLGIKV